MSNTANLPYVCNCGCGFVNGDMFEDYFRHLGKEPTEEDNKRKMAIPKRTPRPYRKTSNHWSSRGAAKSTNKKGGER